MPQVTVYVREKDLSKWKAIGKKAEWLHNQLRGVQSSGVTSSSPPLRKEAGSSPAPPIPGVVRGADFVPKPPDPETGYPCCTKRSPCKHWQWDSNQTMWINSLTGKTREG